MKKRVFFMVLWREKDGSIKECTLQVYERGVCNVLNHLSKREVEYLIWLLADARKDLEYASDEEPLFENLEVDKLIVKVDKDLILRGMSPPLTPF